MSRITQGCNEENSSLLLACGGSCWYKGLVPANVCKWTQVNSFVRSWLLVHSYFEFGNLAIKLHLDALHRGELLFLLLHLQEFKFGN
jgi:hypothetical protein